MLFSDQKWQFQSSTQPYAEGKSGNVSLNMNTRVVTNCDLCVALLATTLLLISSYGHVQTGVCVCTFFGIEKDGNFVFFHINLGSWSFQSLGLHWISCTVVFVCLPQFETSPHPLQLLGECCNAILPWNSRNVLWIMTFCGFLFLVNCSFKGKAIFVRHTLVVLKI